MSAKKNTTTLLSLSDHDILSWEWRVDQVDQVQTNYHCRHMVAYYEQSGATKLLIMRDLHCGRSSTFLALQKASATAFRKAKNVEILVLYPIRKG